MKLHSTALSLLALPLLACSCASEPPPPRVAPPPPPAMATATATEATWGAPDEAPETFTVITLPPAGVVAPTQASPPDLPPPGAVTEARERRTALRSAIANGVTPHHPAMRQCFDQAARTDGSLAGRVTVRFVVAPSGEVISVTDEGSTLPNADVVGCVRRVFEQMKFQPFQGKAVSIIYPIEFSQPR